MASDAWRPKFSKIIWNTSGGKTPYTYPLLPFHVLGSSHVTLNFLGRKTNNMSNLNDKSHFFRLKIVLASRGKRGFF